MQRFKGGLKWFGVVLGVLEILLRWRWVVLDGLERFRMVWGSSGWFWGSLGWFWVALGGCNSAIGGYGGLKVVRTWCEVFWMVCGGLEII